MKPSPKLIAILRRLLLTAACVATALGLFVALENWRGNRAWAALERELHARGEKLDLSAFQPRSIPDEQNLFKAPRLALLLYERPEVPERKKLLAETRLHDFHALAQFRGPLKDFTDLRTALRRAGLLASPDTASAAHDVLTALAPLRPLLDEIRDATRLRRDAAFEPRALPFEPPQVAADDIFQVSQAFGVRAAAAVELGRNDDAFADIFALQRLANALTSPPTNLLQVLVGVAMQGLAAGAISDGLQRHAWTDPQLTAFQQQFAELHALERFAEAIRAERAAFLHLLDTHPSSLTRDSDWPWWMFRGWAQQNKIAYCRGLDAEVLGALATAPDRILADRLPPPRPPGKKASRFRPYDHVARFGLTNIGKILAGLGSTIDQLQFHAVACALERYRLAHGRLPESLETLVPTYLSAAPRGAFDAQPVRYDKLSDAEYRLHSSGRNSRDDSGQDDDTVLRMPPSI